MGLEVTHCEVVDLSAALDPMQPAFAVDVNDRGQVLRPGAAQPDRRQPRVGDVTGGR